MTWRVEILNETVAAEIAALPEEMQARETPRTEIELALERAKEIT